MWTKSKWQLKECFIHSVIQSFILQLLNTYYVSIMQLDISDTMV